MSVSRHSSRTQLRARGAGPADLRGRRRPLRDRSRPVRRLQQRAPDRARRRRRLRAQRRHQARQRHAGIEVIAIPGPDPPRQGIRPTHNSVEQLFASLDIPALGLMAPFVAVTETVGGLLLIAGLATPLVGAVLAIDMLVALLTAHLGQGFFATDGGFELELLLGGASLGIALAGAGRFSLDASLDLPHRFVERVRGAMRTPRST